MKIGPLLVLLIVAASASMSLSAQEKKSGRAENLTNKMLELTRSTLAELRSVQRSGLTDAEKEKRIKSITEAQVTGYSELEYKYNELPQEERMWGSTPEAVRIRTEINNILAETKKLVLEIAGPAKAVPLPGDAAEIAAIIAKHDFIKTFILGMTVDGKPSPDQGKMLRMLEQHYNKSIAGDKSAQSNLDGILAEVLAIYPTERPLAQYNLGVLYQGTGDVETARQWYLMAARNGVEPAVQALLALEE